KNKKIVFNDDGEAVAKPAKQKPTKKHAQPKVANGKHVVNGQQKKPQKIKFDDDGEEKAEGEAEAKPAKEKSNKKAANSEQLKKPQRIKFDDDGEKKEQSSGSGSDSELEDSFSKPTKRNKYQADTEDVDSQKKWYQVHTEYPCSDEVLDMKENEQMELYNLCKSAFDTEKSTYNKRNPTDARWLQTALHKGTAKDRANAGALLVTSNPLGNLEALSTLISFCKISNKSSNEVIAVLTDLWKEVLLPPQRKLLSIHTRGADWKQLKKRSAELHKEQTRRVYAYWYFENELKEQYHEYLKNLMQGLQTGQEHNKTAAIVAAARLLAYAPEKEQMLLTMLINKLGDPIAKIASKALHHLSEVAQRHPNMCGVIVGEAEKLLFRNKISERAQHFALCFLSSIAPSGRPEVCTKLVNICFALFKVLVQKGAVNNRTMQAILRCLQKAIVEAQPANGSTEVLTKEMQDTIYRLVHLADIRVSIQTLGLLLQLITVKTEKYDRFYNALYIKLLDLNLINIGTKTAAQLLHIVHRAIHIDKHVARAQAFVKRLLQLSLYAPPNIAAGCLIVLHKLLRMRRDIIGGLGDTTMAADAKLLPAAVADEDLDKFGSDGEEVYKDADEEAKPTAVKQEEATTESSSSWHHLKLAGTSSKVRDIDACKYDPYHRVPAFAGAGYALRNELLLLRQHYHPTVQVFAEHIVLEKRIDYYGDPLRDFGLPHFLERFAFKNPKKLDNQQSAEGAASLPHKRYTAFGARGKPVKSLTKVNCTEDEMFIFNYLEQKRKQVELFEQSKKQPKVEAELPEEAADDDLKEGEVDDDEFEAYLDGYFGKKLKAGDDAEDEDDINYLEELGGELQAEKQKKKQKKSKDADDDDDMEDMDQDWDDDAEDAELSDAEADEQSDDETGSIDLEKIENDDDDDDDDDEGSISMGDDSDDSEAPESPDDMSDDDEDAPKVKKSRKEGVLDERNFAKKLKHSNDMSSLFAAADDFSQLLEETGKSKGQGTSNAVFNKDKSSDKQLKWEEKRRSNSKNYTSKKFNKGTGGKPKLGKKRKH
ncbi:CG7839, partial [Drosophila busckii]